MALECLLFKTLLGILVFPRRDVFLDLLSFCSYLNMIIIIIIIIIGCKRLRGCGAGTVASVAINMDTNTDTNIETSKIQTRVQGETPALPGHRQLFYITIISLTKFLFQKKGNLPSSQQRRKHQITYLAFQVKDKIFRGVSCQYLHCSSF